jgi:hypothetical protein
MKQIDRYINTKLDERQNTASVRHRDAQWWLIVRRRTISHVALFRFSPSLNRRFHL